MAKMKTKRRGINRRPRARRGVVSRGVRKKIYGFSANKDSFLFGELQALVLKASPVELPDVRKDLKKVGRIKLALISGVFLGVESARVDLLVVGENINLSKLIGFIKQKEVELGREIRYVILSTDEFLYRHDMFDRFLKDIL